MILLGYYLLKVIICSAVLFGYYYIALRNKVFHQWNRYYLLASVVLALSLPLIKFTIEQPGNNTAYQFLHLVDTTDNYIIQVNNTIPTAFNYEHLIIVAYALVSLILLCALMASVNKLYGLIRQHRKQNIHGINLISTKVNGTPFSFLNYIFWNPDIDINTATGKQILAHEIVHVQEKHTLDKLFVNLLLILFWSNPVFWIIRHELKMIHEFIADKKSVEDGDTSVLSAMILHAAYPQAYSQIANSFFQQTIKRRLLMLAKIKNPRISYWSRIIALPLLIFISLAFTLKSSPNAINNAFGLKDTIPYNSNKIVVKDVVLEDLGSRPAGKNVIKEMEDVAKIDAKGNPIIIKEILLDTIPDKKKLGKVTAVGFENTGKAWIYFENGFLVMTPEEAVKQNYITRERADELLNKVRTTEHPRVMIDGVVAPTLTDSELETKYNNENFIIQRLSANDAIKKYGDAGKNGVIDITSNDNSTKSYNPIFTKVENPPQFPGGKEAWQRYLAKNVDSKVPVVNGAPEGSYTVAVQFIVDTKGYISNIKALTKHGYGMEDEALRIIKNGPRWIPAKQNGREVNAYHKQSITFIISSE